MSVYTLPHLYRLSQSLFPVSCNGSWCTRDIILHRPWKQVSVERQESIFWWFKYLNTMFVPRGNLRLALIQTLLSFEWSSEQINPIKNHKMRWLMYLIRGRLKVVNHLKTNISLIVLCLVSNGTIQNVPQCKATVGVPLNWAKSVLTYKLKKRNYVMFGRKILLRDMEPARTIIWLTDEPSLVYSCKRKRHLLFYSDIWITKW